MVMFNYPISHIIVVSRVSISLWRLMRVQYLSSLSLCTSSKESSSCHLATISPSLFLISAALQYFSCSSWLLMPFRSLNLIKAEFNNSEHYIHKILPITPRQYISTDRLMLFDTGTDLLQI